ncbi:MAG: YidH family protein [Thiotrichales bacterium]
MSDLNDPRVFFAAERTLLAWNRTALSLMAFGFVIERFGLFVHMLSTAPNTALERSFSFWIGLVFIVLGTLTSTIAVTQYRTVLRELKPVEIPTGYRVYVGAFTNLVVAVLGVVLIAYLFLHGNAV